MARSPFQGTFNPNVRPTVVTAPDAIVYINGESEVIGCPQCSRTFNFNKFVTSIQTDLSVESSPGSASVSMAVPRHAIDDFYFDGNPVITPMMEIEIYAKGYYLVEGLPQYYPIFWGLVTDVSDNYSAGEHTININCADILKWWELCNMNINPAWTAPVGQQGRNIQGNVHAQTNPYDLIFSLAFQSFGDVVVGTGSLNQLVKDAQQRATFDAALSDLMAYWERRFSRMRSNLVLYGAQGIAVRGETLYQEYSKKNKPGTVPKKPFASTIVRNANGGPDSGQMVFDPASPDVAAFRFVFSNAGQLDLWQSEFQTKLELANAAKEAVGFEFYMDVTGDIVFKPPFYNLDILSNKPQSWIQDIDVIDWDFSESESEVVTQIILQGQFGGTNDYGVPADITPFTSVTDYHLLRKYGWRSRNYNSEFLSKPQLVFYHGLDMLDRLNSKRHRGSVSIPMRPEMRLGFPMYLAPKDQIWYVSGISHNIQFGSRATTSLSLTAKRSKFIAPKGIGDLKLKKFKGEAPSGNKDNRPRSFRYSSRQLSKNGVFELKVGNAASLPPSADFFETQPGVDNPYEPLILRHPKTGRVVGHPNVVMAYTRPFAPADANFAAGQKQPRSNPRVDKRRQEAYREVAQRGNEIALSRHQSNDEDALVDKYLTNRYQYGLNSAGAYIYAHDSSRGGGVINEILTLPSKNVSVLPENSELDSLRGRTALIRPVSDERGFELIGHFQYGRRLFLKDGRLITTGVDQSRASVDLQLSLSGDLQSMLTAQSQGLTTISTGVIDPASTLSKLQPEDLQTAANINPHTNEPEFVDIGDNFVSTGTLESQEQKGAISVEASQLSRALTLSEMSVRDESTRENEDCVCLTGRQDLAFINSGYQVKTLSGTSTEDASVLTNLEVGSAPINTGATQAATIAVGQAEAALEQAQFQLSELELQSRLDPESAPRKQAVLDQQAVVNELESQLTAAQDNLDALQRKYHSTNSVFVQSNSSVVSKVDQFLSNLYQALDTPHQEFESAIRGDLLPKTPAELSLNADEVNPASEFAPPFSAPNRFELGDPNALVGAIESNVPNLKEAWQNFGDDLRRNASRSKLSKQISQDQSNITRLTATRNRLQAQLDSSNVVIGQDLQSTIDSLDKRIEDLRQSVLDNQTKLNET